MSCDLWLKEENEPEAGLAVGALEVGLEAAALAGAASLAGITALAFSSMPTTWSFEAGCTKTMERVTLCGCFSGQKLTECILINHLFFMIKIKSSMFYLP